MTTPATLPAHVSEVLAALEQIPGVASAEVNGEAGDWLRLDLYDGADEVFVRSALADVLRTRTPAGSAESAEVWLQETVASSGSDGGRLALDRLALTMGGAAGSAEVIVGLDERTAPGSARVEVEGEAGGPGTDRAADSAVATALLLALEELTEDAVIGSVEQISFPDAGSTASVRLRLDIDGSEVLAEASVPVLGHRPQALARAVLAAVEPHLPA